jgi:hypothetical protein
VRIGFAVAPNATLLDERGGKETDEAGPVLSFHAISRSLA